MKYLRYILLLVSISSGLSGFSYVDNLDIVIQQKVIALAESSYKVKPVVYKINSSIKKQVSLQEIDEFLNEESSVALFFCNEALSKLNMPLSGEGLQVQQDLQDLQFALGAKLYMYYLECAKQKMLYKAVQNYDALNFWKNEKFQEQQSWYQKNLLRWFSRSEYNRIIQERIVQLEQVSQQTNYFLGLIKRNQDCLLQALNREEFEAELMKAVELQNKFLHVVDEDHKNCDLGNIVKISIDQVYRFSLHLSAQYAQCQLPSHFERHIEGYSLLLACACVGAYVYTHYGEDIAQFPDNFWRNHIKKPLERNWGLFTRAIEGPQLNVDEHKRVAELMMDEELKKPEPRTNGNIFLAFWQDMNRMSEGVPDQIYDEVKDITPGWVTGWQGWWYMLSTKVGDQVSDINRKAQQRLATQSVSRGNGLSGDVQSYENLSFQEKKQIVLDRVRIILANQERNVTRVIPAYSLKVELEAMDSKNAINEVLKDMHLVLGLTALIPMITVIAGSLFASKTIYNSVAYQPIRNFVRHIEILLNEWLYQPISFDCEGDLYFLTEQLKLHVGVLTLQEQKLIATDIDALQSSRLDYAQKFNVVQRMYRTYPCLNVEARIL